MPEKNDTDFQELMAAQSRIKGCLVSGQKFEGKVFLCNEDHFQIVELSIENTRTGIMENADGDIISMRYDAIMYFTQAR